MRLIGQCAWIGQARACGRVQITRNGETKLGAMSLLFTPGTVLADKIVVLSPGMRATLKR